MNARPHNHKGEVHFERSEQALAAAQTREQLEALYSVSLERGLASAQAQAQREKFGYNEAAVSTVRWWNILRRQCASPFIFLLAGAAFIAFIVGEMIDSVLIFLFIAINTALGFYQEYRSEHTAQLLKNYLVSFAKVYRDGREIRVETREVVPGDSILLETGDKIPADVRILEAQALVVDESLLTGESLPVPKESAPHITPSKNIYEATNVVFAGTTIVSGTARGIVIATGERSIVSGIARLASETIKESGFSKGIGQLSKFILRLVVITLAFVFLAHLFIKQESIEIGNLLIFLIALSVAVVPEALPVVTTFSLSRGAMRLAKNKVVVKRLSAIEDLGGIELLCTDKTGTITENILTIADTFPKDFPKLLLYAYEAGSQEKKKQEPFDRALGNALSHEQKRELPTIKRHSEISFDPVLRRNGALILHHGEYVLIIRGAPEAVLSHCSGFPHSKEEVEKWVQAQGIGGRRVLAVAHKVFPILPREKLEDIEQEMELTGLIAFHDPVKKSAISTIKKARKLNIGVKVITGDSKEVAGAVAHEIGLITDPACVITGEELIAKPLIKQRELVEEYAVFARVLPEQKFHIISLLQEKREVGFLGEGINDAPALKIAGVSLVVDSAADIARDAADIILLKKDLHVIINGIAEGRTVLVNTLKYIKATLASNFGNFYAVAIGSLFIDFLPMLPIQILLVNLLSDFPMISIAADTVDKEEIGAPQSYHVKDIALIAFVLGIVSTVFDFLFFAFFVRISEGALQTSWFMGSILTELAFLFSIRTRLPFFKARRPSSLILFLTSAAVATTLVLPFTSFGRTVFHFIPPTAYHLKVIFGLTALYFITSEVVKFFYSRLADHRT